MAVRPVVRLTRKQIYDEVWTIAVSGMALKYNIPYSSMRKQIMDAGIPIPPSGYWTKKEYGKDAGIAKLVGNPNEVVALFKSSAAATKMRKSAPVAEEAHSEETVSPEIVHSDDNPVSQETEVSPSAADVSVLGEPEVQEGWGGAKHNVYRREVLYREVWQYPVTEVAKKYAVSDVAIHKICKSLNIPTPPRGYWEKLRAGKKVDVFPLPPSDGRNGKTGVRNENVYTQSASEGLAYMSEEERATVLAVASQILLPAEKEKQHPKVAAYRKQLPSLMKANSAKPPYLSDSVAEETRLRVFRIIDALIKAAEPLGISMDDELRFCCGQDAVQLRFSEATTEVLHELTKDEKMAKLQYEDDLKRRGWGSKPNIRKYDHIYNGTVSVGVGEKRRFRDSKSGLLEQRLGEILIAIFVAINDAKIAREEREEKERKRLEEEQRKKEYQKRYNEEVARTLALENQAEDYAMACKIRALIAVVESGEEISESIQQWLAWAKAKADWYDPTIFAEDEFFSKRKHGQSAEEKKPKEMRYYWW